MTKKNQEQNQVSEEVQERMNKFQEGLSELVEETGITVQATLNYGQQGIQPVINMQDLESLRAQSNPKTEDATESTEADESEDIVVADGEE